MKNEKVENTARSNHQEDVFMDGSGDIEVMFP